jgi:hypothetical protein
MTNPDWTGGQPQPDGTTSQYGVPQPGSLGTQPPDYQPWVTVALIGGVLFSLLIGLPLSVMALRCSRAVRSRWRAGDLIGAERASRSARGWLIAATIVETLSLILVCVLLAHGTQPSS